MPNNARRYHQASDTTTTSSTVTTDTVKVTLTFTPDANSTYLYIWSCETRSAATTVDNTVRLKNNAGTILSQHNHRNTDVSDWCPASGIASETFGASPTSQSITLTFASSSTTSVSIRNAKLIAIKLTAADVFVENVNDQTTTSTTFQNATTLTFTPATPGSYLILGSAEFRTSNPGTVGSYVNARISHNSIGYNGAAILPRVNTNYTSGIMQASIGTLSATSQSVFLQWNTQNASYTANCRRARLVALRLDEFTTASITSDSASTFTTNSAYINRTTTGALSTVSQFNYLIISSAVPGVNSTTASAGWRFTRNGTTFAEIYMEGNSTTNILSTPFFASFDVFAATTSTTVNFDYGLAETTNRAFASNINLSVLLLEPTDLYWVGGSGTWDSSTATNWALTSGGTGGAAAPKSGTNVNFDNNSDSAAPFTVTVGTGATCTNLTASGLDNTMTLSGTAALSVYGNFAVPSTNFTQSYTGTITFASTGSKTITTNGNSFTAFTFNGVGGTWTLQDALTLSGGSILTNGTLALGSYNFTCLTFESTNSNVRTLNFGTGKIVVTASTGVTVWNTVTTTNLTVSGTPSVQVTGGGATTKTISSGALSQANSISFQLSASEGNVTFVNGSVVKNLIIDNNSFSVSNVGLSIYGNLTVAGTIVTLTSGTNAWTFAGTLGTQTITTNGNALNFPLIFTGTGTYALGSALSVTVSQPATAITLTSGTLELNSYTFTVTGIFSTSGTGVRRIQMSGSGGKIVINHTFLGSSTIWTSATTTNLTSDGNVIIQLIGGVGGTTSTLSAGTSTETNSFSFQISSTAGTVSLSGSVINLTIDNNSIVFNNNALTIYGNLIISGTSPTINAGANIWTFAATSGTKIINLNGNASNTVDFPLTFNGIGGTWQLQHALNVGTSTSRTVTLTNGILNLNSYTLTIYGIFSSSGSTARTIAFGSTGKIVLTLGGITAFTTATATNLTVTGTNPLVQLTGTGTTSLTFGAHTETNSLNVQLSPTTTSSITLSGSIKDLTIDNFNITLVNSARTLYGNFTVSGTTPTIQAGTNATTFAATSGTKTINLNGNASNVLDFPITFNGVGGTWQLQHALSIGTSTSRTVTLTNGSIDLNGYTFTIYGVFTSTNSNTRSIAFGSTGKIVLSLAGSLATTIWSMANGSNFTTTGTPLLEVVGSGTLVRTLNLGSTTVAGESGSLSLNLLTSAGTIGFGNGSEINNFTVNCAGTTVNYGLLALYGSFLYTAGTIGTAGQFIFTASSGIKTINTGGATTGYTSFTITNASSAETQLASNITLTGALTLISGTFTAGSFTPTIGSFISSSTIPRTLNMGSSTWAVSAATGWDISDSTNLTLNKQTANINSTYSSTAAYFYGGGQTYNNVTFAASASGILRLYGSNTFNIFTITNNGCDLYLENGSTNTFTSFVATGISGSVMIMRCITVGGTASIVYTGTSKIRMNYLTVQDIYGYPDNTWYVGYTSNDSGGNFQIYFTNPTLYWVGGQGTWDNTNTAPWSYFSGNLTSAGYVPDLYTPVYFDANSDIGTAFTINTASNSTVSCYNFVVDSPDVPISMFINGNTSVINVFNSFTITSNNNFTFTGNSVTAGRIRLLSTGTNYLFTSNVALPRLDITGTGSTWYLQDDLRVSYDMTHTAGSLYLASVALYPTAGNKLYCPDITVTGTTARAINFAPGSAIYLTGANSYWRGATLTSLSIGATYSSPDIIVANTNYSLDFNHGGTSGGASTSVETRTVNLIIPYGTTSTIVGKLHHINFTGYTGTFTPGNIDLYGDLTLSNTMTVADSTTRTLTFSRDLGQGPVYSNWQNVTTNGTKFKITNLTFAPTAGNYVYFTDEFKIGDANTECLITLTTGNINLNGNVVHYGTFVSSATGVRAIYAHPWVWKLTNNIGAATTVWNSSTATNFTKYGLTAEFYGTGAGFTRTISPGSLTTTTESNAMNIVVDITDGSVAFTTNQAANNVTFKDKAYTFLGGAIAFNLYGSLTIEGSSNLTFASATTGTLSFIGTGTQYITTSGELIDRPVTFSGNNIILNDALTIGSTKLLTFNSKNLYLNNYTLTTGTFASLNTNPRYIDFGSTGSLVVAGSGASAFATWPYLTSTNTGTINMTSASAKGFTSNDHCTFPTLNQGGAGTLSVYGNDLVLGTSNVYYYNITSTSSTNTTIDFSYFYDIKILQDGSIPVMSGTNQYNMVTINAVLRAGQGFIIEGFNGSYILNPNNYMNFEYIYDIGAIRAINYNDRTFNVSANIRNYLTTNGSIGNTSTGPLQETLYGTSGFTYLNDNFMYYFF